MSEYFENLQLCNELRSQLSEAKRELDEAMNWSDVGLAFEKMRRLEICLASAKADRPPHPSAHSIDLDERRSFDRYGYDERGFDRYGYDEDGYDSGGRDERGYDREGYDYCGYDEFGDHRDDYHHNDYSCTTCDWSRRTKILECER